MADPTKDLCGKCGAEIDTTRRIDYTLKDGTRVCDSCFVKGTASPTRLGWSTEAKS
jgi:NMD protein affecting ribosome stability and mRNA decay